MERDCQICFSIKKKKVYHQEFCNSETSLLKEYDVVVCKNCGFIFADNIPIQEKFTEYYSKISRYELDLNEGQVSDNYYKHNINILHFIEHFIELNSSILDIGCSTGTLLKILKLKGFSNLYGIDPSLSCIKFLKEKYNIKGNIGNLSNLNLKKNKKFDLIILSSVVEHIVDLKKILYEIRRYLKNTGLLFIEIPDASRFKYKIYTPFQQFSIEHINYFTNISIKNLLKLSGYRILNIFEKDNRGNQTIDPCFFIMANKIILGNEDDYNFEQDKEGIENIKEYIQKSKEIERKEIKKIKKIFEQNNKLIIWGVGTNTQRILNKIKLNKISYFVDSNINYINKKLECIEIKLPKEINSDEPILILSWSYQDEIIQQIKNLKLKNEIITIYD